MLKAGGLGSLALVTGCGDDARGLGDPDAAAVDAGFDCLLTPEQTASPFYFDPAMVRSNIAASARAPEQCLDLIAHPKPPHRKPGYHDVSDALTGRDRTPIDGPPSRTNATTKSRQVFRLQHIPRRCIVALTIMRIYVVTITSLVALAFVVSCGPKDGKYNTMSKGKLHTDMWRLVTLVDKLDFALKDETKAPSNEEVVGLLTQMDGVANRLGSSERDRHPLVEDNIDEFRSDIVNALKAAKRTPPNYYFSGKVTGACILCHDPKGGLR